MFGDGPLTFREFVTREPVPLAQIHDAVLEFLRDRLRDITRSLRKVAISRQLSVVSFSVRTH